jgi:peptidoglycan hydrolase-like protein with peptidoglycan-binding domain
MSWSSNPFGVGDSDRDGKRAEPAEPGRQAETERAEQGESAAATESNPHYTSRGSVPPVQQTGATAAGHRTASQLAYGDDEADTLIRHSVGKDAHNAPRDVAAVQRALAAQGFAVGRIDGIVGPKTLGAIHAFQRTFMRGADGVIQPGGPTEAQLLAPSCSRPPSQRRQRSTSPRPSTPTLAITTKPTTSARSTSSSSTRTAGGPSWRSRRS